MICTYLSYLLVSYFNPLLITFYSWRIVTLLPRPKLHILDKSTYNNVHTHVDFDLNRLNHRRTRLLAATSFIPHLRTKNLLCHQPKIFHDFNSSPGNPRLPGVVHLQVENAERPYGRFSGHCQHKASRRLLWDSVNRTLVRYCVPVQLSWLTW